MGVLDNVLENVKSVADRFGKTANKVVDVSKLKMSISEINTAIRKRYGDLGEYIYNSKKNGDFSADDLSAKIAEIDDLYEQLNVLNKEINVLRNKTTCPNCGKEVSINDVYCVACGTKLPEAEIPAEETVVTEEAEVSAEESCAEQPAEPECAPESEEEEIEASAESTEAETEE